MATQPVIRGVNSRVYIFELGTTQAGAGAVTPPTSGVKYYVVNTKGTTSAIPVGENRAIALRTGSTLTLVAGDSITPLNEITSIPAKKWGAMLEDEKLEITNQTSFNSSIDTKLFKTFISNDMLDLSGTLEMDFSRANAFQSGIFDQYFAKYNLETNGSFTGASPSGEKIFVMSILVDNQDTTQSKHLMFSVVFSPPKLEFDITAVTPFSLELFYIKRFKTI